MGYLNAEQSLFRLLKFYCVLAFNTVIGCHEKRFNSLTSELLHFLFEVIFDILQFNVSKVLPLFIFLVKVGILRFNSKQPRIHLVPENLYRDSIRADFKLKELVHIDVVDVKLGIGNFDCGEGYLV